MTLEWSTWANKGGLRMRGPKRKKERNETISPMKIWETKYVDLACADRVLCDLCIYVHTCVTTRLFTCIRTYGTGYITGRTNQHRKDFLKETMILSLSLSPSAERKADVVIPSSLSLPVRRNPSIRYSLVSMDLMVVLSAA